MFKKKKQTNEFDDFSFNDIDSKLSEEEQESSKPKSKLRGVVLGVGIVGILGGGLYMLQGVGGDEPLPVVATPVVEEDTGFDTDTDSDTPVPEDTSSDEVPVTEQKDKELVEFEDSLPSGFVSYKSGYLNVLLGYSQKWLLSEKTQNSLDVVSANTKEGLMDLKDAKYNSMLEVVSLKNDGADVFIGVVPSDFGKVGVWQDGFIESNKDEVNKGKSSTLKSLSGDFNVLPVDYKQFGEDRRGVQYQHKLKDGVLTIQLVVSDLDKYEQYVRDTDALVESLTFE